jgi:long-chain acyl-CoA synthetase
MTLILDALRTHAQSENRAVIEFGPDGAETASITYRALMTSASAIAQTIQQRTAPKETVMLALPNGIDFCTAFVGVLLSGRTVFPVQRTALSAELMQLAEASGASLVIARDGLGCDLPLLDISTCAETGHCPTPKHPSSLILQTSGTTGKPKLVLRESHALDAVAQTVADRLAISAADRVLVVIPMGHSYGLEHGLLSPLFAGAAVCSLDGTMPAAINRVLCTQHITILPGVPVLFESMSRDAPARDHTLRLAYSAGSRLAPEIAQAFRCNWGVPVGQIYGSSDVGSVLYADPDAHHFDESSVGLPLDGVSVRIISREDSNTTMPVGQKGIVAIRARSMLSRYVTDHPLDLVDGHLLTGDLGTLDEVGSLRLSGRHALVLDIGGKKVSPEEVEAVLRQHQGVQDCAVTSVRVSDAVSRLRAAIVPSTPAAPPAATDLRAFARARLQPHKVPRTFVLVDQLPRSSLGKVIRSEIA